ncbi:GFA family protein [Paenalcaligenes sp. Me131]|uniref:GFA family protein n=1 Tax=Paenalcaligenes sp. Me131 TaxID=3392636 RepID=UPI003D2BB242
MQGSCLCGAVAYEIDQLDMPIGHCHCHTCRKAHAAAYASTAGVMREHFRWIRGEDLLTSFESSPGKLRRFCSVCGSHLVAERTHQPHVILRVATLDEDQGGRPSAHIWRSHDVAWLQDDAAVQSYPEWQAGR